MERDKPTGTEDRVKILLIADNPQDVHLISGAVESVDSNQFHLRHVTHLEAPLPADRDTRPDIVLYASSLSKPEDLETFDRVYSFVKPVPTIVLSSVRDEGLALRAVQRGAQDYLVKSDIHGKMLARVLRYTVERVRVDQKMLEQAFIFRKILSHIPHAVYWKDRDSVYRGCNEKFAHEAGMAGPEAIVGKTDYDLGWGKEMADLYRQTDRQVIESGQPLLRVEETRKDRDGKLRTLLASKVPFRSEKGDLIGIIGIYEDITERKKLEGQLFQAQKMESIGRLAGGVAHDFNNLLMVISGYTEFLLEDLDPKDPHYADVKEIENSTESAIKVTQQLLAFSRRQIVQPTVVNLNDLILKMDLMIRRLIGSNIEVVTLPAAGLGPVMMDPSQLEQVVMNLAVNARDAMPEGGVLTLETANVDLEASEEGPSKGPYVLLKVTDTGCGIREEDKPHIFEPFFTTKGQGKGTGLGLATSYGILHQNGGFIEVDSKVGEGTTFRVYLPRVTQQAPAAVPEPQEEIPGGHEGILVVEDNSALCHYVVTVLKRQGYKVFQAVNGVEAVRTFEKSGGRQTDLLLTDLVMPQMSGKDLQEKLQAVRPGLKTLFMSGYTRDREVYRRIECSGVPFLQKPFSAPVLLKKVREVLDGNRAKAAA